MRRPHSSTRTPLARHDHASRLTFVSDTGGEIGGVLLIANTGAYGRAMSSHYNLRKPARELFLEEP